MKGTLLTLLFSAVLLTGAAALTTFGFTAAEPVVAHEVHFSLKETGTAAVGRFALMREVVGPLPRNKPVVAVLVMFFCAGGLFVGVFFADSAGFRTQNALPRAAVCGQYLFRLDIHRLGLLYGLGILA